MTGVLGGTFDPPHNGHLGLARAAIRHFALERLVVVVAGRPPHKEGQTDAEIRLRLAAAAFEEMPGVEISRHEVDRPGASFSVETARYARCRWGDVIMLVGADQFADFLSWHEPAAILDEARLGVATRPGVPAVRVAEVLEALGRPERVELFEIPPVDVSSRELRRRIGAGEPVDGLVPAAVGRLIDELGLYRGATAG